MNKIYTLAIATLLLTVSHLTYAGGNSYCNSKTNQHDFSQCYNWAIETQNTLINLRVKTIDSLPKISNQWKIKFHHDLQDWSNRVNIGCHGNAVCTYSSMQDELSAMGIIIYKNK